MYTSSRYVSRTVVIGNLTLGGTEPIRIQSMTNTDTLNTKATVDQTIELIENGCEMVRVTASTLKEARNLALIKEELQKRGYTTPLIADVHFLPEAALIAAETVEKIRINPGNYTDRNSKKDSWSELEYSEEIAKIEHRITPLIETCKKHQTVLRIGSNHGSLSNRIMYKYGNTAEGMVEAAMEFIRICSKLDFHNLVLSMKASNTQMMVFANRLLIKKMDLEGFNYPIHLGVTEAGEGEDGRIKSALGIGTLLAQGLGDTIRVSLTEPPVKELQPAQLICNRYNHLRANNTSNLTQLGTLSFFRRTTTKHASIGGGEQVKVVGNSEECDIKPTELSTFQTLTTGSEIDATKPGYILCFQENQTGSNLLDFIRKSTLLTGNKPITLHQTYKNDTPEAIQLKAAADFGSLLIEGVIDAIWIETPHVENTSFSALLSFNILQAARLRFTKAEFISCPSCGRTKYNIVDTVANIRSKTGHLTGLTIGIMGCIVNGPGEMAGADYGYVGEGANRVSLYKGNQAVMRGVDEKIAIDKLIELIKIGGDWVDPPKK